jgi:hypothetical protein
MVLVTTVTGPAGPVERLFTRTGLLIDWQSRESVTQLQPGGCGQAVPVFDPTVFMANQPWCDRLKIAIRRRRSTNWLGGFKEGAEGLDPVLTGAADQNTEIFGYTSISPSQSSASMCALTSNYSQLPENSSCIGPVPSGIYGSSCISQQYRLEPEGYQAEKRDPIGSSAGRPLYRGKNRR